MCYEIITFFSFFFSELWYLLKKSFGHNQFYLQNKYLIFNLLAITQKTKFGIWIHQTNRIFLKYLFPKFSIVFLLFYLNMCFFQTDLSIDKVEIQDFTPFPTPQATVRSWYSWFLFAKRLDFKSPLINQNTFFPYIHLEVIFFPLWKCCICWLLATG